MPLLFPVFFELNNISYFDDILIKIDTPRKSISKKSPPKIKETDKKRKRVKERSIKYVREKVAEWRRIHTTCKTTQTQTLD
jgi:hypothetical protein